MRDSTSNKKMLKKTVLAVLPFVFWIGVWWGISAAVGMELLIPSPPAVLSRLCSLAATAYFWETVLLSLLRIFLGALIGVLLGTLLAALTSRFFLCRAVIAPMIKTVRAVPVASFIILVLLWVTKTLVPGVISCLVVMPVMWQNVTAGTGEANPELKELAQAYRFSRKDKLKYLYAPAVAPHFYSGLCSSIGFAWKSGVAAEVLCLPQFAIGTQVYYSKLYLDSPSLFAWTIAVIILSLGLEKLVRLLLKNKSGGRKERGADDISSGQTGDYRESAGKPEPVSFTAKPVKPSKPEIKETEAAETEKITANEILKIDSLSFAYNEKTVFDNYSLKIRLTGITALKGASGCGKTTLLKLIARILKPKDGNIAAPPSGKISLLFQEDRLFPGFTCKEQLLPVLPKGEDYMPWLFAAGLSKEADVPVSELSGGMRRRLSLARTLAYGNDKELLLLDEPFTGVDAESAEKITDFIKSMEIPVILTAHDSETLALADRVIQVD